MRLRIVVVAFVVEIVAIFSAASSLRAAAASGADFDIAPFARRCCVSDRHTSPLEFDYDGARNTGADAQQTADGRYVYGLQWTRATLPKCAFTTRRRQGSSSFSTRSGTGRTSRRTCLRSRTRLTIRGMENG